MYIALCVRIDIYEGCLKSSTPRQDFFFYNDQHFFLGVVSFELYTLSSAMFQGRYASLIERFVEVLKISIYSVVLSKNFGFRAIF